MRRPLTWLVPAAVLLAPGAAVAAPTTGRLLVTLRPRTSSSAQASALAFAGARPAGPRVPQIDLVTVRPEAGRGLARTARALRRAPDVRRVEVEHRAQLRLQPNDPALTTIESAAGTPPGIPVEWWAARSGLFSAWDITRGATAKVAVIDTGADASHPELSGKIDATADHDDINGDGPATVDENGHGTHVASLACGAGDNGIGIVGAGLDCRLIIIKSDLSDSSVAASIVDATDRGADAINMSFGTDGSSPASQAVVDAVDYAVAHDVVLVAAAADSPTQEQGDPANVLQPNGSGSDITAGKGLSVTAASFAGTRASFAGTGSEISMAAYGQFQDQAGPPGILGAFPGGSTQLESGGSVLLPQPPCGCRTQFGGDSRYAYLQGTSMAAPMVAATAALIAKLNPDLHAAGVIRLLKQTASRPPNSGWTPDLGWGILDAGAAMRAARVIDLRPPKSSVRGPRTVRNASSFTIRWSGTDSAQAPLVASGIKLYNVYRSTDRRQYVRIAHTRRTSIRLHAVPGARYRFYTRAVDNAGNREAIPRRPDLSTLVAR